MVNNSSRASISIVTPSLRHKSFSSAQTPLNIGNILASNQQQQQQSSNVVTQAGIAAIGDNKNGKSCVYVNVVFPKPFTKQPIVHGQVLIDQHTLTSSSQAVVKEVSNTYAITILSTTTTGFCCVVRRVSKKMTFKPWVSNIKLQWFATMPSFCSGRTVVGVPSNPVHSNTNMMTSSVGSSSDTIMISSVNTLGGAGSAMGSAAINNPNNMVYLMSVTINLPPIPTSWNHSYNSSSKHQTLSSGILRGSSGESYTTESSFNSGDNTVAESPTVSTSMMYSNAPTLIPTHPPVIVVTPHASDGNSDETFVASVREIYPNRFVAVIRRVGYENSSKPWTQPIKLNWSVFYNSPQIPNPYGKDCIIKAGVLPVGQNIANDDYTDREIRFMQSDIPNIPGNNFVMPRLVICTPRCDPQLPNNDIHSVSLKTISPYGFSINMRHIDSKTWHQNLYICYLAFYKLKRKPVNKKPEENQPQKSEKKTKTTNNLVPYNSQVFIKNCTNGFVLEASLNDHSVVVTSEKSFLLSQDQRFIFRETGFIELATNCDYVLECITLEDESEIVVSEKRDTDNSTQKWLVFQPVNPITTESVCIANVGNLNLVLDCENDRGSTPYVSSLNMAITSGSSSSDLTTPLSGETTHHETLTTKDKSKTQQWKFTMVQENL